MNRAVSMSEKSIRQASRTASDIQQDIDEFIQRNLGLYGGWVAMAMTHPIDDGGALAGNNRQKGTSAVKPKNLPPGQPD
jgi:hypothetical protein